MAEHNGLLSKTPTIHYVYEDDLSLNFTPNKTQWSVVETSGKIESFDLSYIPRLAVTTAPTTTATASTATKIIARKHLFEVKVRRMSAVPSIPNAKIVICCCKIEDPVLFHYSIRYAFDQWSPEMFILMDPGFGLATLGPFFAAMGYGHRKNHDPFGQYNGTFVAWRDDNAAVTVVEGPNSRFDFTIVPAL